MPEDLRIPLLEDLVIMIGKHARMIKACKTRAVKLMDPTTATGLGLCGIRSCACNLEQAQ